MSDIATELRNGLLKRGMIILRGKPLEPVEQFKLARMFGAGMVTASPRLRFLVEHPYIFRMSNDPQVGNLNNGQYWHCDGHYFPKGKQAAVSIHHIVQPTTDGQTFFCPLSLAFESLTSTQRSRWSDLRCLSKRTGISHPLFDHHPITNKPIIYPNFEHGSALIDSDGHEHWIDREEIIQHLTKTAYEHTWQLGDTVISDQFAVAHCATSANRDRLRILHRITIPEEFVWYRAA